MALRLSRFAVGSFCCAALAILIAFGAHSTASGKALQPGATPPSPITIDYPADSSIFPPEITPPTFLWHDADQSATSWEIDVAFASQTPGIRLTVSGDPLQQGEIDPNAGPGVSIPRQSRGPYCVSRSKRLERGR